MTLRSWQFLYIFAEKNPRGLKYDIFSARVKLVKIWLLDCVSTAKDCKTSVDNNSPESPKRRWIMKRIIWVPAAAPWSKTKRKTWKGTYDYYHLYIIHINSFSDDMISSLQRIFRRILLSMNVLYRKNSLMKNKVQALLFLICKTNSAISRHFES